MDILEPMRVITIFLSTLNWLLGRWRLVDWTGVNRAVKSQCFKLNKHFVFTASGPFYAVVHQIHLSDWPGLMFKYLTYFSD